MAKEKICISCGKRVINDHKSTAFPCPSCIRAQIIRCGDCRKKGISYKCSECNFEGP